jgi:histidinol-phosphatase (PHP family)
MKVDLHNHTILCNHATGSVDDYVQAAIECGVSVYGFSDHAPMDYDLEYRMGFDQMDLYEQWVHETKEKYSKQIDVLLGYEVDYLAGYMDDRVLKRPCDYLIGSIHFVDEWGFDNPDYIHRYNTMDMDALYSNYFGLVENMAKTGYFDIVGHLDLLKVFGFFHKKDIRILAKNALIAIKKANMTIELNVSGWRKPVSEAYPSLSLLESIAQLEIPITFGSDAHRPDQVGMFSDEIEALAKSVGYTHCATYRNRDRELIKF